MIELGDKVRDKITGFTGIVVAKTEFINKCIQFMVVPKGKTNSEYPTLDNAPSIDSKSLEIIKKRAVSVNDDDEDEEEDDEENGGATSYIRGRGY